MKKNTEIRSFKHSIATLYIDLFGKKKCGKYQISIDRINSTEVTIQTVTRINSLKIEIRSSEKPHNMPHFHVTAPGRVDAVYTISPTVELYKGNINSKDNKLILKWAKENREILVEMWNDYHGYRIKAS